jgi:hypothetical protein
MRRRRLRRKKTGKSGKQKRIMGWKRIKRRRRTL